MARNVEGQRNQDAYHLGYLFQVVIYIIAHVAVGASLVSAGILDDGQQVVGGVLGILCRVSSAFPWSIRLLVAALSCDDDR